MNRFGAFLFFIIIGMFIFMTMGYGQSRQESSSLAIARVKYRGGGDWYNDPTSVSNLCRHLNTNTAVDAAENEAQVELTDESLFSFPILFMTGHGRILLSDEEISQLRMYLLRGGFLYADDDYGMDKSFREVMKKVFPDKPLLELPFSHDIYRIHYRFDNGLPKIHEHDEKPPQGFGIFDDAGRLMVFYTFETNLSDGWADPNVHNDPPEKREAALRMGTNIVVWALLN